MRNKKHIIVTLSATLSILILILFGSSEYFLHFALNNDNSGYNAKNEFDKVKADYPWIASWVDSIRSNKLLRDSFIINRDGKKMHAWYVPSPKSTGNTAVIVHGYKSNSVEMMHIGYMFNHDLQWNILLPDLLAHGKSEGHTIQMGWEDRKDVMQWTRVAHGIFSSDTIIVHGISMGASTAMCFAGDENPEYIRGFIEDCGYTSAWDEFKGEMKKQFGLPSFPILNIASLLSKIQYGWSFDEASSLNQVEKSKLPMLFIHGSSDTYVPTSMVYSLYKAKPEPKDIWIASGSIHAKSYEDHHEEYTERTKAFINKYINKK